MEHALPESEYIPEAAFVPPSSGFVRLKGISTQAACSSDVMLDQVRENMKLNLPMVQNLPEFNKVKGKNKQIALVGGGPSLKNYLNELKEYKTIISCGSVHDYLITNNIIPTYAVNCDPDPVCAKYFTKSDTEVKYLIASNAAKEVIEILKDKQLILWHCHSDEQKDELIKIEWETYKRDYQGIGGGCTVGLRSISIAMCLGYSNIHMFGFDSCMKKDGTDHHAYDWATPEESNLIEKIHRLQIGPEEGPEGKDYYLAGYQLAQLENFKDFYYRHREYFIPTFRCDGALPDYYKLIKRLETDLEPIQE